MPKMKKTHDLCVAVNSYKNKDGEDKKEWLNIGFVLEGKRGPALFISKAFNPAGVIGHEDKANIPISMFPVRDSNDLEEDISF